MKNFYKPKICRLCNSRNIEVVLSLNKSPLCDAYIKKKKEQQFYDLKLCLCNNCKFVQINTVVDPKIIYRNYIYVTTSSLGLNNHFKKYTQDVCRFFNFKKTKFIVDIGSNDGTLLSHFKKKKHKVLGIEPAFRAAADAKKRGIKSINEFFDKNIANKIVKKYGYADFITINNLFANVDDLHGFTKNLELLLGKEGVIAIESSYLLDMINNMIFDFIYHEHLSYLSILPLRIFFKKFDLKLIRIQKINTKGGSLRYYLARKNSKWPVHNSVYIFKKIESDFNISKKTFNYFNKKIKLINKNLSSYLSKYKKCKIAGYGASATSTTLISHFKLYNRLDYLIDDNPGKINTFSPGYHIPVYNYKKITVDKPDIIIILAWRYYEKILQKLKKINFNNLVVIPIPKFKIASFKKIKKG